MIERRMIPVFEAIIARRWWILALYGLLLPGAIFLALDVGRDNSLENMVVASDPDVAACRSFLEIFPEGQQLFLLAETAEPFSVDALRDLETLGAALQTRTGVSVFSIDTLWRRLRPGAGPAWRSAGECRDLIRGIPFFREQGLVGDHFLGIVVAFDTDDPQQRDRILEGVDSVCSGTALKSIDRIRQVGRPLIDAWLEKETAASSLRYFPLFGAFVIVLLLGLFRSVRALTAILSSLAVAVLLGMACAGVAGFSFTIVSALVPLTLMVTATASLIYLHSRYIDQPEDVGLAEHRVRALANKFVAVTASVFSAAVGFAALTVSPIRPIRELGLWTSGGLLLGWMVCLTLYPALQTVLACPTRLQRNVAGGWVFRASEIIPRWSYRWRWPLVLLTMALCLSGLLALTGLPGVFPGMHLETDALAYVDPDLDVVKDSRYFSEHVLGLASAEVWITTPEGGVIEPDFLRALDHFGRLLKEDPAISSVVGLMPVLRLRHDVAAGLSGSGPSGTPPQLDDIEMLLISEPEISRWVDLSTLGSTYLKITAAPGGDVQLDDLRSAVERAWHQVSEQDSGLEGCAVHLVGAAVMQETISRHLVPTLLESFAITFSIIFITFVAVFRSGPARLNAMVPSLFAILVTFLIMRLTGMSLNIATILIATTVLGVTENDQIHFFYHFLERRKSASTEEALAYTIRVAGHAILLATIINAGGFLALVLSKFPPMRQFGIITSAAFALAMLADFTALPAALWIFFRERPGGGESRERFCDNPGEVDRGGR